MTSRMLFELLGFLLSTNAKVKKMTTVSAVMFEIVEMYIFQIHLHYFFLACCMLKQNRDFFFFLNLFQDLYRLYLFNSAEYLTASKTVAYKQVQNFRPPRSFDFQLRLKINLRKPEKSFQRSDQCINSGTNSKIK
jgi:hypothetical protein